MGKRPAYQVPIFLGVLLGLHFGKKVQYRSGSGGFHHGFARIQGQGLPTGQGGNR